MIKILVMGLSGSGKTYLSKRLKEELSKFGSCLWLNADKVRQDANDWDFSYEGRIKQGQRMNDLAEETSCDYVIFDFIAPLEEVREKLNPDWVVWVDTVKSCEYEDTNFMFQPPRKYDFHITTKSKKQWQKIICADIINNNKKFFDLRKPTVQMLGRFQPWHDGHQALFERALEKTGQVAIMVRDCYDNKNNPYTYEEVQTIIRQRLDEKYLGSFEVFKVPNIVNITYGRDVGYDIEREHFDSDIESISATQIRSNLNNKGEYNGREKNNAYYD